MQGHDIQITTTELNHSSSGFQFPLCFHSVLIWTLSFHSDCLLKFYESLQLTCFAIVTEVHHWNNHTNLWMLLIESFFNSIAGKHQSQSNYGFLLLRFVAEMCKSLKYPPTIWNTKAPCITILSRPFNLHPGKWFEGYLVKSTYFFQGGKSTWDFLGHATHFFYFPWKK